MSKKIEIKKRYFISLIVVFFVVLVLLVIVIFNNRNKSKLVSENSYNMVFYELVEYVQNVEVYLAKSMISNTPEHAAETLTNVWREANLAQAYLAQLPVNSQEFQNTEKFLNQVSDYSYSLSRKNIYDEGLSDKDFENIKQLHDYSVELENTLNQLSEDINSGRIKWKDIANKNENVYFAQQVSTDSLEGFSSLEENFHEYAGLIYDGAFSEHLTNLEKRGLVGQEVDENQARDKVYEFLDRDNIKDIQDLGFSDSASIPQYSFSIQMNDEQQFSISVSKVGGHIIYMDSNRTVNSEIISQEDANEKAKDFLNNHGFKNMKETYFLKQDGIVTINYAFVQDNIVVYSDLIKVKVALDDGEILGVETTGYLSNHLDVRKFPVIGLDIEKAKDKINKNLLLESEGLAVIPTEFQTEILCYEFKGKIEDKEFLVYINAENGREEDVLVIIDTPNGTLTM